MEVVKIINDILSRENHVHIIDNVPRHTHNQEFYDELYNLNRLNQTRSEKQTRSISRAGVEIRANNSQDKKVIAGYFAVFDDPFELFEGAFEEIAPSAFDNALRNNSDVRALINHDTTLVLGRTSAGTLSLKADSKGLYGEIIINENDSDALNLYERVKRGDVSQCSFGFKILKEDAKWFDDGTVKWRIEDVELYEVSCCTYPAYKNTGIEARHNEISQHRNEERMRKMAILHDKKRELKERMKKWH